MRKSDREIRDFSEIVSVVGRCQVVRMGIYADDFPYVVPLTFGYEVQDGALVVYFHCATKGRKLDLLAKDARVCLEWDILTATSRPDILSRRTTQASLPLVVPFVVRG